MVDLPSLFRALGVSRYDAALPEGRISWRVPSGAVVARARCEVVLSFAALDGSVVYGADHAQLRAAGVPIVPLDGVAAELRPPGPMTEPDAERVAVTLASQRGAPLVYRCRFGHNALFVAVFDVELFPAGDETGESMQREALAGYVGFVLRAAAEARRSPGDPALGLALQQLDRVLAEYRDRIGVEAVDRVRRLLERCQASPSAADLAALTDESRRWPEAVSSPIASDFAPVPPRALGAPGSEDP